jgi:hypothetical protein
LHSLTVTTTGSCRGPLGECALSAYHSSSLKVMVFKPIPAPLLCPLSPGHGDELSPEGKVGGDDQDGVYPHRRPFCPPRVTNGQPRNHRYCGRHALAGDILSAGSRGPAYMRIDWLVDKVGDGVERAVCLLPRLGPRPFCLPALAKSLLSPALIRTNCMGSAARDTSSSSGQCASGSS